MSMVSARYTTMSGRRLVSGTSWSRTSKSVSAFQSGPAAASRALASTRARRLCRLEALGLTTTIPSTISMPAHCSSDHDSYSSAVTWACIHCGAIMSTLMRYPLEYATGHANEHFYRSVPSLTRAWLKGDHAPIPGQVDDDLAVAVSCDRSRTQPLSHRPNGATPPGCLPCWG